MRVLFLADRSFAEREHAMLRRLEVGLTAEGVQVARAVPTGSPAEATTGLSASLSYPDDRWRVGALSPALSLAQQLVQASSDAGGSGGSGGGGGSGGSAGAPAVDIVHVWGEGAWWLGTRLAVELGADLAIEASTRSAALHARELERAVASARGEAPKVLWLTPDEASLGVLLDAQPRSRARCGHWGVHVPPGRGPEPGPAGRPLSFVVLAPARTGGAVVPVLEALAGAASDGMAPLVFLDARAAEAHPAVWRRARALGLLSSLSVIDHIESRRQLVLEADALLLPDASGEHRSLVLEAMAAGMVVVGPRDPFVGALSLSQAALPVEPPTRQGWDIAVRTLLVDAPRRATLGAAARRWVEVHALAHRQVEALLSAYLMLVQGGPIPFRASAGASGPGPMAEPGR